MKATIKLENPNINIVDIDLSKPIGIMVGENGSGKTLVLVLNWVVSMFVFSKFNVRTIDERYFQELMNKSFDDFDFSGELRFESDIFIFESTFKEGKILIVNLVFLKEECPPKPIFMSKNIRLFSDMEKYLKLKKKLIGSLHGTMTDEMLEFYKIYEALYIESLIQKTKETLHFSEDLINALKNFMPNKTFLSLDLDFDNCCWMIRTIEGETKISVYSAGEQALLNMLIANYVLTR